jgi:hypothetical protein
LQAEPESAKARRSMFEPGGKSVHCQILHESLLSPCMFERQDMRPAALA